MSMEMRTSAKHKPNEKNNFNHTEINSTQTLFLEESMSLQMQSVKIIANKPMNEGNSWNKTKTTTKWNNEKYNLFTTGQTDINNT